MFFNFKLIIFLSIVSWSASLFAQLATRSNNEEVELEDLYDRFETEEKSQNQQRQSVEQRTKEEKVDQEVNKISELSKLQPFEDVAVLQKKFLPKTSRFEFSGSGLFSTNNQYYSNFGLSARAAYFFSEKYGLEANYQFMGSSEREVTDNLINKQNIKPSSLVEPESFYGLAFKWVPIYGKMAWFQRRIIPFEVYFLPGLGVTNTASGSSDSTFSFGGGQLFALSKSYGVRWDITWNYFATDIEIDGTAEATNHSDIFISIGFSFFFPEAKYR